MSRLGRIVWSALAVTVLVWPVAAQIPQVDCQSDDLVQMELNFCAEQAWIEADEELNLAYRLALTEAKVFDENAARDGRSTPVTMEEVLRQAQRDWIPFRDNACAAEAMLVQGGSMQPMIGTLCLERLTRRRLEDLMVFFQDR